MTCRGARAPRPMLGGCPVTPVRGLTKRRQVTNFVLFRGHLSRPACSHVKKLAKQAGDRMIPAEPPFRPGFLFGLSSVPAREAPRERRRNKMVSVKSIPSPAIAEERSH